MTTSTSSPTRVDEIRAGIYRISTKVDAIPGGFTFNQYLIDDEEPVLFHTGPRKLFPLVSDAVSSVTLFSSPDSSVAWTLSPP